MSYRDSQRFRKVYGYYRPLPRATDTSLTAAQEYVDGVVAGIDWKQSVRVASTTNVNVNSPGVIDGITLADEDRVLLKDQSSPAENGIYIYYTATGTLIRTNDAEQDTLTSGAAVYVEEGTENNGTAWILSTIDPIVVGTTNQTWVLFSTIYPVFVKSGSFAHATVSVSFSDQYTSAIGSDVYFFVSGTIGNVPSRKLSVFGGDTVFSGSIVAKQGFSGSLTKLADGTSYLIAGTNITIASASNGAVTISSTAGGGGGGDAGAEYLVLSHTGSLSSERRFVTGSGLKSTDGGAGGDFTLSIDDAVVATISGATFTGVTKHNAGLSGSLTQLVDGTSYLIAGTNITIASQSNGSITISSTAATESYFSSTTAGSIFTSGSAAFRGAETSIDSPRDAGIDVFFYVSGSRDVSGSQANISLFGGDLVTSGSMNIANGAAVVGNLTVINNIGLLGDLNVMSDARIAGDITGDNTLAVASGSTLGGTSIFNGVARFNSGLSGSLTKLTDGSSYLVAGNNIAITTQSNGSVTIASTGGADGYFVSTTAGSIYTTGSVAFTGGEAGIDSALDKGTDVFFYVSGSISGSAKAVFGGDVRISGALALGPASAYIRVENEPGSIVFSPHPDPIAVGADTFFYVSGTISGSSKSVFGGDVRISGSLTVGTGSVTITSNDIQFGSPSARFELDNGNIKIYDASNPSGSLLGSGSSGNAVEATFTNDITVSLSGGKTFGRYSNGQTIPATGKTAREVILMVSAEPINPTVSLIGTNPITAAFNTTSLTGSLTGSYTINSLGASVSAAQLQWRSGSSGNWSVLSTSTTSPLYFEHKLDVPSFFTTTLNYQYIVTDTLGAISTGSLTITPQSYSAPTATLTVAASSPGGITGESNSAREKGNVASTITGTITRNRANVPISAYSVQYQVNGSGGWTDVPGLSNVSVVGNPSSINIPSTSHNDTNLKSSNSLVYRVQIVDSYQTTNTASTTITFYNVIFYGPVSAVPTTSTDVRAISNKMFTNGSNPFTLNSGTTLKDFTVAVPASLSLSSVVDLDALNANITNNYVLSTFNVNDAGGTATSYKVYTLSIATPYSTNHRHQVTRA